MITTAKVTGIYVYPVKSMKGIALDHASLSGKGLENDRRWMIVRSDGRFVTQRDMPELSLVHTSLDKEGLLLSRAGHGSIRIPYSFHAGGPVKTRVWKDDCEAVDQGEHISKWLTNALGSEEALHMVRLKPGFRRELSKSGLMTRETTTDFADGAPMLVANEASLARLNTALESNSLSPVEMNRFRPNIVVEGLEPFAEHKLGTLSAESYQLKLCFPCERCIVTTIDQDTAEINPEGQPFKTLQKINPMPGNSRAPAFGENAILTHGENERITVGDNLSAINS